MIWSFTIIFALGTAIVPRLFAQTNAASAKPRISARKASVAATGPTILLSSDVDCTVTLDDMPSERLTAGTIRKVRTTLGDHLITAATMDGQDSWKTVLQVEKPVQKVVVIELLKVKTARESAEAEATHLEQEIVSKEKEAERLRASHQTLVRQRAEIDDKIAVLKKRLQAEERQAANDETSARQQQGNAQLGAATGGNLGNLTSMLSTTNANNLYASAQKHRAQANQIRDEIVDLERQMQSLGEK